MTPPFFAHAVAGVITDARGATVDLRGNRRTPRACEVWTTVDAREFRGQHVRLTAEIHASIDGRAGAAFADSLYMIVRIVGAATPTPVYVVDRKVSRSPGLRRLPSSTWRPVEARFDVPPGADSVVIGIGMHVANVIRFGSVRELRLETIIAAPPSAVALPTISAAAAQFTRVVRADSANARATGRAPVSVIAKLDTTSRAFLVHWFAAWADDRSAELREVWRTPVGSRRMTDEMRLQRIDSSEATRLLHCHPGDYVHPIGLPSPQYDVFGRLSPFLVRTTPVPHARCPSWLAGVAIAQLGDQALDPDTAIAGPFRSYVSGERDLLIAALDYARRAYPRDERVAMQHLRMVVDQRDTAAAVRAVATCALERWRCGLHAGFVAHWRGMMAASDSLFETALRVAPDSVRCRFEDLGVLLPTTERRGYEARDCRERIGINRNLWWLSDPAYAEAGNERRATHRARVVAVMLRSVPVEDDPYDWDPSHGGGSLVEMMTRYGWPTSTRWRGRDDDEGHNRFLSDTRPVRFTTTEYALDRYHTVPSWEAIERPLAARAEAWELTPRAALRADPGLDLWWPSEHIPRARGVLIQLPDYQIAMFRRDTSALVAIAAALDPAEVGTAASSAVSGWLAFTAAPDSVRLHPARGRVGSTAVAHALTDSRPQLVGLEVLLGRDRPALARTRFAVSPPEPLTRLQRAEVAISDLALLTPLDGTADERPDPDRALPRMLGSARLRAGDRLELYWETYGISASDSMDVTLTAAGLDAQNGLRRLGQALRIVGRPSAEESVRWRESRADAQAWPIAASVPSFGRHITLNLSGWQPGRYRFTITVAKVGGGQASASRDMVIGER